MKTIGIDQSSIARSSFEHRCMNNTKKIYQHAGNCYYQQNLKDIIDAAILSTPEGVRDNNPNVHMTSKPVKNQVLGNHCVYSQTYWLLNLQHPNVVLWLQNPDANLRKCAISFGQKNQNEKGILKSMSRSNVFCIHG